MAALDELQKAINEAKRGENLERAAGRLDTLGDRIEELLQPQESPVLERLDDLEAYIGENVDLRPVKKAFNGLRDEVRTLVEAVHKVKLKAPETPKREWTFDVKRNRSGFIKTVDVVEK